MVYNAPGGITAYPNPGTILAYKEGAGLIDFDQSKAERYFDEAVTRVRAHLEETIKRWERL